MAGKKIWNKKKTLKLCSALAIIVVLGSAYATRLKPFFASAKDTFAGVETVVDNKMNSGQPFRILEVIPDGAASEIGYLVDGAEPQFTQTRFDEYLTLLREAEDTTFVNDKTGREKYINDLAAKLTTAGLLADDGSEPLGYTEYIETYFPTDDEKASLQYVDLSPENYEKLSIAGNYVPNSYGTGYYNANVLTFTYQRDTVTPEGGNYYVEFSTIKKSDEAPYNQAYELKYDSVNSLNYYQTIDEGNMVAGRTYYYVSSFRFDDTSQDGIYVANINTENPYKYTNGDGDYDFVPEEVPEGGTATAPTYEVPVGRIWYTGGITNNNWFERKVLCVDESQELPIEVTTVTESQIASLEDVSAYDFFYIGGNNTYEKLWDPDLTDEEVTHTYGKTVGGTKVECLDKLKEIYEQIKANNKPCMIDGSIVGDAVAGKVQIKDEEGTVTSEIAAYENTDVYKLVIALIQATLPDSMDEITDYSAATAAGSLNSFYNGNHTQYAQDNICCLDNLDASEVRHAFFEELETVITAPASDDPFAPVRELISTENTLRVSGQYLSEEIDKTTVIQYIINFQNKRVFSDKTSLKVLDVEPAWGELYENSSTADSRILTTTKVSEWTGVPKENITIVHMATSEFVGKIEDMNITYDMIYFGVGYNEDYMNRDAQGKTVYNDTLMNGLVYAHVGDVVIRNPFLEGILDSDYVNGNTSNFLYGTKEPTTADHHIWGYRNISDGAGKITTRRDVVTNFKVNNTSDAKLTSEKTINLGNVNTYRFSGNDITYSKMADLQDYVNARYPIVFADEFFTTTTDGKVIINGDVLDNSSILYEFLDGCMNHVTTEGGITYVNGFKEVNLFRTVKSVDATTGALSEKIDKSNDFQYYMDMPKISLVMYNPEDNSIPDDTGLASGTRLTMANSYGNKVVNIDDSEAGENGIYTLIMKFRIASDIDASASTRYDVDLYMDMNSDGRFISNDTYTEEMKDITVYDADTGKEIYKSGDKYQLNSGKEYLVKKEVSSDLLGVLTWKLEVSQNSNQYIRTSKVGYTVMPPMTISISSTASRGEINNYVRTYNNNPSNTTKIQVVRVLQVNGNSGNWNLNTDGDMLKYCKEYLQNEGVWFDITTISNSEFKGGKYADINKTDGTGYDMLVFGFQDSYPDIEKKEALDAVDTFIQNGKSVLFTHDCTSMVNVGTVSRYSADDNGDTVWKLGSGGKEHNNSGTNPYQSITAWGYNMNQRYREYLGMDRYGVTFNENFYSADENEQKEQDKKRSLLLKQGQVLDLTQVDGRTVGTIIPITSKTDNGVTYECGGYTTRDTTGKNVDNTKDRTGMLVSATLGSDKDIAYVPKSGRTQSYSEVQGYGYGALNFNYVNTSSNRAYNFMTEAVGTNYNYRRGYSISGGGGDAMGQCSDMRAIQVNEGQITHYPYEIGKKINLASTHYQYYMLNMDEDKDGDGSGDMVVWYCLSSDSNSAANPYKASRNDVANNYYIYSVGSVLYSGVGHSSVGGQDEKKLFFNTFVAAYNLGVKPPSVSVLDSSSRASNKTDSVYIPVDTTIGTKYVTTDNTVKFYYTVSEPNLVTSEKVITVDYQLKTSASGSATPVYTQIPTSASSDSIYITTEAVSGEALTTVDNKVSGLMGGHVYEATIHNIGTESFVTQLDGNNGVAEITINVSSAFSYYGEKYGPDAEDPAKVTKTQAETTFKVRRATLFDLD